MFGLSRRDSLKMVFIYIFNKSGIPFPGYYPSYIEPSDNNITIYMVPKNLFYFNNNTIL